MPYQDVETEEPIITENEVEHLQSHGSDETQPYDSEFVNFEGDYFVLLGRKSANFKSYDVDGFRQFCQYLAKNGKKTPKAESVIIHLKFYRNMQNRSTKLSLMTSVVSWTLQP